MSASESIINQLQNMEITNVKSDNYVVNQNENKTMCCLLKLHLKDFYDDIFIPYRFFRDENWDIYKVLYDNMDVLYYSSKYVSDSDYEKFFPIFTKYMEMIEQVFTYNNVLYTYLKKWTDMKGTVWKSINNGSYLKWLMTDEKYQIISPSYIANYYYDTCEKYNHDMLKIKVEMEQHLDKIKRNAKKEQVKFEKKFRAIVFSYVYEPSYNTPDHKLNVKSFINCVFHAIIDFSDKMIDLHIYALHPLINSIVGSYIPLDDINVYKSAKNDNKHLVII